MINKIRNLNQTLPELLLGIFIHGIVSTVVSLFFLTRMEEKSDYFLGLFLGIFIAVIMAVHMAWSLNRAMDLQQDQASGYMKKHNLIRYGVVVLSLLLIMISGFLNPITAFLGIMGLKTGAYMVPVIEKMKLLRKRK
jgi:hypothetical protein